MKGKTPRPIFRILVFVATQSSRLDRLCIVAPHQAGPLRLLFEFWSLTGPV
jgi:hypothetical protein